MRGQAAARWKMATGELVRALFWRVLKTETSAMSQTTQALVLIRIGSALLGEAVGAVILAPCHRAAGNGCAHHDLRYLGNHT